MARGTMPGAVKRRALGDRKRADMRPARDSSSSKFQAQECWGFDWNLATMSRMGVLRRIAAAFILLALTQSVAGAPASPPSIRIEAVTISARSPLGVGTRLPVSVRGTGGGSATFHVFGVVADIGMRELRTAGYQGLTTQYTGTYVVRPGDGVRNGALFATLAVRGTEVMAAGPRGLTIDGRPPRLMTRQPAPGARLANLRPNIALEVIDLESGMDPASVRLVVNGQNVTARASISETSVTYNPATPFRPGPVRLELTAADRAGNRLRAGWGFEVTPPTGLISSVTINPATALTNNDLLTVVVAGAAGAKGTFSIQGLRGDWPMKESGTKGIYFGTIVVLEQNALTGRALLATLEKDGRKSTVSASVTVTVLSRQPAAPTISTSVRALSLDDPGARLDLSGAAPQGYRILGRVDYATQSSAIEGTGTLGEFVVLAGADGRWRTSLGPLVPLAQARLTVTVVAVDPAGRRSPPATLEVTSP